MQRGMIGLGRMGANVVADRLRSAKRSQFGGDVEQSSAS